MLASSTPFASKYSTRVAAALSTSENTTPKPLTTPLVVGFGVVFSDVDKAAATRVEYFDANGVEIASIASPAHLGVQGFTFVGAVFESAIVARVLITSGEAALDATSADVSAGGTKDLVVMDDFIYGEPQPLPQTSNYSRSL